MRAVVVLGWLAFAFGNDHALLTNDDFMQSLDSEKRLERTLDSGSVQGFLSHQETGNLLESWVKKHPHILKRKTVGKSVQGRPLHVYVLGSENQSPQVLQTSLIHAREPAGMSALLYALGSVLHGYAQNDSEAVYLVHGREQWIWPMVNPDGYVANQRLDSDRLQRKNMRNTQCANPEDNGVDLNRNFDMHWQADADPCSATYGGPKPFSEPESAAFRDLCANQSFITAINMHSHGHFLTHPWNYGKQALPAETQQVFDELTRGFDYKPKEVGSAIETVGYTTSGESDDWAFGARKIVSMSPEVGHQFWPAMSALTGIHKRNLPRHKLVALVAGLHFHTSFENRTGGVLLQLHNKGLSDSRGPKLKVAMSLPHGGLLVDVTGKVADVKKVGKTIVTFETEPLKRRSAWSGTLKFNDVAGKQQKTLVCVSESSKGVDEICHCSGPYTFAQSTGEFKNTFFVSSSVHARTPTTASGKLGQKLCRAATGALSTAMITAHATDGVSHGTTGAVRAGAAIQRFLG